jgi:phage tail sheath gpL-like
VARPSQTTIRAEQHRRGTDELRAESKCRWGRKAGGASEMIDEAVANMPPTSRSLLTMTDAEAGQRMQGEIVVSDAQNTRSTRGRNVTDARSAGAAV